MRDALRACATPLLAVLLVTVIIRNVSRHDTDIEEDAIVVGPELRRIISDIANSDTSAISREREQLNLPAPMIFTPPVAVRTPAVVSSPSRSYVPQMDHETTAAYEQASLIKFISGAIAVFCPTTESVGEIARHIVQVSDEHGLDPLYVASVISMESGFRTSAKSSVGATGLMQILPSTAQDVFNRLAGGEDKTPIKNFLQNPEINIRLGIDYLKSLEDKYRGDRYLALAAYNWGPTNVDKARRSGQPIPGSVKKYSSGILERTAHWQRHFRKARESAQKINVEPTVVTGSSLSST